MSPVDWLSSLEEKTHVISHPLCLMEFRVLIHHHMGCRKPHHRRASIILHGTGVSHFALLQRAIANLGRFSCSCRAECNPQSVSLPPVLIVDASPLAEPLGVAQVRANFLQLNICGETYSLSGVIIHHPGHWTALACVENHWYLYDDTQHAGVLQPTTLNWSPPDEAMMLVYSKRKQ